MSAQYLRKLSLVVSSTSGETIDFADFRCVFSVRRGDIQTPNSADVRIYNLSDDTANTIAAPEFTQLAISAGYAGNFNQIFSGTITQFRRGRENQKDTFVDLTAADGDAPYQYAPVSLSLVAGSAHPGGIAQALATALASKGITRAQWPAFSTNPPPRGKVLFGLCRDELRKFAFNQNCAWSIQDGKLTFIPYAGYMPGEVPVISAATGLIGIPEQTPQGITMRVLLNSMIKIGQAVKLDNSTAIDLYRYGLDISSQASNALLSTSIKTNADGLYYVMVANHYGDTRGEDWYSDLVCLAIDATVPSADAIQQAVTVGPLPRNPNGAVQRY